MKTFSTLVATFCLSAFLAVGCSIPFVQSDAKRAKCLDTHEGETVPFEANGTRTWNINDFEAGEVIQYSSEDKAKAVLKKLDYDEDPIIRYGSLIYYSRGGGSDFVTGCLEPESDRAHKLTKAEIANRYAKALADANAIAKELVACIGAGGKQIVELCTTKLKHKASTLSCGTYYVPWNCQVIPKSGGAQVDIRYENGVWVIKPVAS